MRRFLIAFIKAYRYVISPLMGDNCRFYPSCSHYAEQAITEHGPLKGTWMAMHRISKCHPWHDGGIDPVPPNQSANT